jgi:hypothetical protein
VRVIIAGSRSITDPAIVDAASGFEITEVVCGISGVDTLGWDWATQRGIPVLERPAAWSDLDVPRPRIRTNRFGKRYNANAGKVRNYQMARETFESCGGGLIAVWDGVSDGTKNMIEHAKVFELAIFIFPV